MVNIAVRLEDATRWERRDPVPLLQSVRTLRDLRSLDRTQLAGLAAEIRSFLIDQVGRSGGHLGSNLGVVELTIALHRVFRSPEDTILWDTGHQAYVHKILTGRQHGFDRLRAYGGLSGYPSRGESEHDVIENSHASTALSWADGIAKARQLSGLPPHRHVVAVVGDGALTGGMAWEALNNIGGGLGRPVIVVLNDNGRSYAPTVGAVADHLATLQVPGREAGSLFESLGLRYLGPVDGHDVAALESAFEQARCLSESVVVHCVTRKGQGHQPAEQHEADRLHTVGRGDGSQPAAAGPSWTSVFAREIVEIATERPDVVGITAAMPHPVGLDLMARAYPSRVFDVGIAEQHAVTSAAGMASAGLHPVVAIYATFLNRAFDQVLMDVALHRAGVTFVLDRAGITGDDGPSHNGMWDLSMLQLVPGLRIAAPRDAAQLRAQLWEAVTVRDCPTVVRFPKGNAGPDLAAIDRVGRMDVLARTGDRPAAPDVLVVSVGPMADVCLQVAHRLAGDGIAATVVDPRWVKPVDPVLPGLAARHRLVVTVEDNLRVGGAGSMIAQALRDAGVTVPLRDFGLPHRFLDQGQRQRLLDEAGLRAPDICAQVVATLAGLADGATER
jgi:1-deoxy-D-xylulose-5-phosphate synthase